MPQNMPTSAMQQPPLRKVLIIGATGGIGNALLTQLSTDSSVDTIFATYHNKQPAYIRSNARPDTKTETRFDSNSNAKIFWINMDVTCEQSIKNAITEVQAHTDYLDWIINAVGLLHTEDNGPEKAVSQINSEFFMQNMTVNALPSLLIAKYVKRLIKNRPASTQDKVYDNTDKSTARSESSKPAIFATISARVGSISDNQLGGWYSYRMSKAALNMGLKTLSIEWMRTLKQVCVVAIQPGTVDTDLSQPFQANVAEDALFEPKACAMNLISVLNGLKASDTGCFVDWSGSPIKW